MTVLIVPITVPCSWIGYLKLSLAIIIQYMNPLIIGTYDKECGSKHHSLHLYIKIHWNYIINIKYKNKIRY